MKKKTLAIFLALGMVAGLTACGGKEPSASDVMGKHSSDDDEKEEEKDEEDEKEEEEKEEKEDKKEKEDKEEKEKEEKEEKKDKKEASGVVFGSKDAAGYTDFEYLTEQMVSTSDTKSGEKATYTVYIPDEDYVYVSGSQANSSRMGVAFKIDIAPYLQYNAQDYTLEENLQKYVDDELEFASDYYGVEVGEIQSGDGEVSCELTYMLYRSYEKEYIPYYSVYYLRELEDGLYGLIKVEIESPETTGKTEDLLDELEEFYQIEIGWDASFTEAKQAAFENSDEFNPDAFNIGYMMFELPEGWDVDDDLSDWDADVFAPGGNGQIANGYIAFMKEYDAEGIVNDLLRDPDSASSYFEEDGMSNISVEDYGDTFMGRTAKVTMTYSADGDSAEFVYYVAESDFEQYIIHTMRLNDSDLDVEGAAEKVFETGVLK